ncbi:MAG: hypothetical protein Alpg2KO_26580 [Alphaproteobacteria bacterium]
MSEDTPHSFETRLAALQDDFTATLFADGDNSRLLPHLPPGLDEAEAAGLIEIYRNNLIASLIEALRAAFPVSEQFVGAEFFSKLARVFLQTHPPDQPRLSGWGGRFAPFIAGFKPAQQAPALAGIARFEWAQQVAWFAADTPPLTPADLAGFGPDQLMELDVALHPSLTIILDPTHPVHVIWERHQQDPISLANLPDPPDALAIWRMGSDVVHRALAPEELDFLSPLMSTFPLPLGSVAEASGLDPIPLQSALGAALGDGWLCRRTDPS